MDAGGGRGRGRPVPGRWGLRRGGGPCVQPDPVWAEGRGGPAASLTRDLHGSTGLLCKVELCLLPCLTVRDAQCSPEFGGEGGKGEGGRGFGGAGGQWADPEQTPRSCSHRAWAASTGEVAGA